MSQMTSYVRFAGCFVTVVHLLDSKVRTLSQQVTSMASGVSGKSVTDQVTHSHVQTLLVELAKQLLQPIKRIVMYPILIGEVCCSIVLHSHIGLEHVLIVD